MYPNSLRMKQLKILSNKVVVFSREHVRMERNAAIHMNWKEPVSRRWTNCFSH